MTSRLALVALDPVPLSEIAEVVRFAERAFALGADDLVVDAALSQKLGVVMAIVPRTDREKKS